MTNEENEFFEGVNLISPKVEAGLRANAAQRIKKIYGPEALNADSSPKMEYLERGVKQAMKLIIFHSPKRAF